jgi:hypothetical protein
VRRSPHRATTASTAVTAPGPDARASCGLCERRPSRLKRGALHTHLLLALLRAHGRRARRREAKATALALGLQAIFVQPDGGGDNRTPALAAKEARAKRAVGLHEPYRVSERARHELGSVGVTPLGDKGFGVRHAPVREVGGRDVGRLRSSMARFSSSVGARSFARSLLTQRAMYFSMSVRITPEEPPLTQTHSLTHISPLPRTGTPAGNGSSASVERCRCVLSLS